MVTIGNGLLERIKSNDEYIELKSISTNYFLKCINNFINDLNNIQDERIFN